MIAACECRFDRLFVPDLYSQCPWLKENKELRAYCCVFHIVYAADSDFLWHVPSLTFCSIQVVYKQRWQSIQSRACDVFMSVTVQLTHVIDVTTWPPFHTMCRWICLWRPVYKTMISGALLSSVISCNIIYRWILDYRYLIDSDWRVGQLRQFVSTRRHLGCSSWQNSLISRSF